MKYKSALFAAIALAMMSIRTSFANAVESIKDYVAPRLLGYMHRTGMVLFMAENTVPVSLSGATLSISATLPDTYDAAGYASTDIVYTLIGEIENYGNHGGTATITEFTPVDTAIVAKIKGSKNYGTMSLMMAHIPTDAGQVILEAAFESTAHYSVKLTYPSGRIHYMDVLVAKNENQDGAVNDVQKYAVDLALCRKPIKVAAA